MELGLRNKIALVAASSQGLGRAIAESLSEEGATVVVCSRDKKILAATAKEISTKTKREVFPVPCDVSHAEDVEKLVSTVIKKFGTIHILVNNAGGPPVETFDRLSDAHWAKGVELTMMSAIRLTRAVIPFMQKQHWGRIITVNSIAGKQPIQELVISSALRPGLIGLHKVLATQYAKDGILINTVCPGFVMTKRQEEISVGPVFESEYHSSGVHEASGKRNSARALRYAAGDRGRRRVSCVDARKLSYGGHDQCRWGNDKGAIVRGSPQRCCENYRVFITTGIRKKSMRGSGRGLAAATTNLFERRSSFRQKNLPFRPAC